ncbi:DNA-binding protein [Sneathiella marina]|uniref:DNA-binding protein n=1 Tax=Sneathiella marina TaxID=2950108 RepID=A0ABY4W2R2_9PROT|nr:DNA-binding protein [Sneathiella marina]USG61482.1 DNA-binding protein [Sneathiella marina]
MVTQVHQLNEPPKIPQGSDNGDFWYGLIPEDEAANFVGQKVRTLQDKRQKGGGPKYVRISSRCIKYRRIDLKEWADGLLRKSTSDTGKNEAA